MMLYSQKPGVARLGGKFCGLLIVAKSQFHIPHWGRLVLF
jgi:hypothetical protein